MEIERLVVGQLQTNCYLVWDKESKKTVIIDPADSGDYIVSKIQALELQPKLIVATHGHVDHILAVTELRLTYQIPFLIHQADLFLVKRIQSSARYWFGIEADPPPEVDKFIKEGDLIKFGKEKLKVIETPGHSPGGVALYNSSKARIIEANGVPKYSWGVLFSGDTLFRQGVGRTDFSYASEEELMKSIKKLFQLPENTEVYPGHGEKTTLKAEKSNFSFERFPLF